MRFPLLAAFAAAAALCTSCLAHADTITSNGASVYTIAPSEDTVTLNPGTFEVANGDSFVLDGSFFVGYSPIPDQDILFTLDEVLTVNGVTQTVTFNMDDSVTNNADYLVISALGPVQFGDATLTFGSFISDPGGVSQTLPVSIPVSYDVTKTVTPEPSSLVLLGTGALSAAGAIRRRLR